MIPLDQLGDALLEIGEWLEEHATDAVLIKGYFDEQSGIGLRLEDGQLYLFVRENGADASIPVIIQRSTNV